MKNDKNIIGSVWKVRSANDLVRIIRKSIIEYRIELYNPHGIFESLGSVDTSVFDKLAERGFYQRVNSFEIKDNKLIVKDENVKENSKGEKLYVFSSFSEGDWNIENGVFKTLEEARKHQYEWLTKCCEDEEVTEPCPKTLDDIENDGDFYRNAEINFVCVNCNGTERYYSQINEVELCTTTNM